MDGPHRLTRRQALRLGAGAAALGALRVPSPAFAASDAGAVRARDPRDAAPTPRAPAGARRRCSPRRGASISSACAGRAARTCRPRSAPARPAGAGRAGRRCPRNHAGDGDRTDPVFTGAADEFQLRLRGERPRPQGALRPRPPPRSRAARPRRPGRRRARDGPARRLGRRPGPAAQPAELRQRAGRVRAPHGHRGRLRAGGIGRHRPRHRALPPRLQRLERHRLQLPRRPLRRHLRGPRGRHRGRRDRRPGAGLEQLLDRHRLPRDVHEHPARRARDGVARAADRLEALAARRARPGPGHADLRRRREQPLPERHAGRSSSASAATATAARPPARASRCTRSCPRCAARAAQFSHPVSAITVKAASQKGAQARPRSPACCASPTAPRPRARRSASSTWPAGSAWTQVTTTACGARRQLGDERACCPPAARSARSSPATRTRGRLESAPIAVRVVPSMTLTSDKRRAPAGTAFAISGTLAPSQSPRRVPARAPGRLALGDGPAQAHQRPRRALRDQGAAEEGRACTASRSSPTASRAAAPCARATEVLRVSVRTPGENVPCLHLAAARPRAPARGLGGPSSRAAAGARGRTSSCCPRSPSRRAGRSAPRGCSTSSRRRSAPPPARAALSRTLRSSLCAMALLTCSAVLVVAWHGTIEAHFHYFVMVGALALYEEWWAYLLAIGFVVLQHGAMGALQGETVFDHAHDPWRWAGIHGLFVAALALANLISWRANEGGRAATEHSEERFRRAFDDAPVAMALVSPRGRAAAGQPRAARADRPRGHRRPALLGPRPGRRPRGAARELAARVRRARGRAPLHPRRRQHRLDPLAPLADPRRRRPARPLHLPGRRHHRPQARRRAPRPPGPPRPAHRPAEPHAVRPRARPTRSSAAARRAAGSPSCSPTSTTSRSSTTRSATAPATSCWSRSPSACRPCCAPTTRSPASAATSS